MKRFLPLLLVSALLAALFLAPVFRAADNGMFSQCEAGDLIEFGSYPQSRVDLPFLIDQLEQQPTMWMSYGYYTEGKPGDFMEYADVELAGEMYRAVRFSQYRYKDTNLSVAADDTTPYTEQDDNGYEPGTVYWFKYEPIAWRVLDSDTGLIVSENILDSQAFCNEYYRSFKYQDSVMGAEDEYTTYGDPDGLFYASDWGRSDLRAWLNGTFLTTVFGPETPSCIRYTQISNDAATEDLSDYNADPTFDRVFLLTNKDVTNPKYGFETDEIKETSVYPTRQAVPTDYAKCQGIDLWGRTACWLLRTPTDSSHVVHVNEDGNLIFEHYYVTDPQNSYDTISLTYIGTRPAMYVDILSASAQGLMKKIISEEPSSSQQPAEQPSESPEPPGQTDASDAEVRCLAEVDYTGVPIEPSVTVEFNGEILTENADYVVAYSDNTNVGEARVRVKFIGIYTGEAFATFRILPIDASSAAVSLDNDRYLYTGAPISPSVSVTLSNGQKLAQGTDYAIVYANNVDVGTAEVHVYFAGNYTGEASCSFEIVRDTTTRMPGDTNADNQITAADARLILRHSARLGLLSPEAQAVADVVPDGRINAADARKVLRVSARLETMAA